MTSTSRPRFTLVSAVYNVAAYLPEFIDSIEGQIHPLERVEVVMVDDGSTDDSLALLRAWERRRPELVTVLTQANAGQAAARNTGLAHAHGEWVSFPDPDDVLEQNYLASVSRFLGKHPDTHLVATNRLIWMEDTGKVSNSHPLRYMFRGDKLVDLVTDGKHFQGSAPAAFFRLDQVRELDLNFDTRVRPIFEDGHFTCRYLLSYDRPMAGFLGSARYRYRKRRDGTSTMQTARAQVGRYTSVMEHGYLDVVRRALDEHGAVPSWLQSLLVFDLSWYFTLTDSQVPEGAPTSGPAADHLHSAVSEILATIDLDEVVPYTWVPIRRIQRYVLQHAYRSEAWREPFVLLRPLDKPRKMVQASWFFTGPQPREEFRADGEVVEPLHAKTRNLDFCGRTLLRQRMVWLPSNRTIDVRLDGSPVDIVFQRPAFTVRAARAAQIRWQLGVGSTRVTDGVVAQSDPVAYTREGKKAQRLAGTQKVRDKYDCAWVLMDRIHDAGDSAEILFRHIRANHPRINAWFVLEKGNAEWQRLSEAGFGNRLVAHGSMEWRLLMANAIHLISSHADEAVVRPAAILEFTRPRWKYHFLNHGVIKDDLSAWLNRKEMDTFVTSSQQEYASIAGDETPYTFTTREVKLTGMPRLDRLIETGNQFPPALRDLVLVAPTWRKGLLPPTQAGTQRRVLELSILDSDFFQRWQEFLNDPRLAGLCEEHGARVGFLPHPNMQPLLPMIDLPSHVQPLSYEGHDVQEYFARAKVLVTDFSSIAFNAAYLERPVVYFQFDEDTVLGGGHVGRRGYFDYRRDGFGPVETTAPAAVTAVSDALAHGPQPMPTYLARIEATFPMRDGKCSARVVEAIRETMRSQASAEPTPTPVMPPTALASDGSRA